MKKWLVLLPVLALTGCANISEYSLALSEGSLPNSKEPGYFNIQKGNQALKEGNIHDAATAFCNAAELGNEKAKNLCITYMLQSADLWAKNKKYSKAESEYCQVAKLESSKAKEKCMEYSYLNAEKWAQKYEEENKPGMVQYVYCQAAKSGHPKAKAKCIEETYRDIAFMRRPVIGICDIADYNEQVNKLCDQRTRGLLTFDVEATKSAENSMLEFASTEYKRIENQKNLQLKRKEIQKNIQEGQYQLKTEEF